jgi:hypothetical protein
MRRVDVPKKNAYDALALRGFLLCLNLFLFRANTYVTSLSLAIRRRGDFGMARAVLLFYYLFPPNTCQASLLALRDAILLFYYFTISTRHLPRKPVCALVGGRSFWHVDETYPAAATCIRLLLPLREEVLASRYNLLACRRDLSASQDAVCFSFLKFQACACHIGVFLHCGKVFWHFLSMSLCHGGSGWNVGDVLGVSNDFLLPCVPSNTLFLTLHLDLVQVVCLRLFLLRS